MMSLKNLLGKQVKLLRGYRKMTQEDLAELVGIDIRQLARIESGESFATSETIEKISKSLKVSYKDLFDFENIVFEDEENMTSDDILKFKKNYSILNKQIQKIAQNDDKTEYLSLAIEALSKKSSLEKLKSIILGMTLK